MKATHAGFSHLGGQAWVKQKELRCTFESAPAVRRSRTSGESCLLPLSGTAGQSSVSFATAGSAVRTAARSGPHLIGFALPWRAANVILSPRGRSIASAAHCRIWSGVLGELHAKKVDLYLHQQGVDTSTPAGKALFQMMGVFAEFERAIIVERINAGLARAKANGVVLGRPRIRARDEERARKELAKGTGVLKTAKLVGIGTGTVQRIKREMLAEHNRRDAR
jgi:resolvase-like protein